MYESSKKRRWNSLIYIWITIFFVLYVCMHMNIRTLFTYRNIPNTYEYILQKVKITYSERTLACPTV